MIVSSYHPFFKEDKGEDMSDTPTVFIASSAEASQVAEAVHIKLSSEMRVKNWENAFDLSSVTITKLIEKTKTVDYAVFVFHTDDKIFIREKEYSSTRDNVVLELGMFIGALGLERCFILVPKSAELIFRLPTDLAGVTASYYDNNEPNMVDAVTASCASVKLSIRGQEAAKAKTENTSEAAILRQQLNSAQSELWMKNYEVQSLTTQAQTIKKTIELLFFSIAKRATPAEINSWEEGARDSQLKDVKIAPDNVYFVDKDVIIPQLYGAQSVSVIVGNGVKVFGADRNSHNRIYYMDGFRADRIL